MTDFAAYARRNMINPFDPAADPDRHQLWQRLVAADCDAFVTGDWAGVEADFDGAVLVLRQNPGVAVCVHLGPRHAAAIPL